MQWSISNCRRYFFEPGLSNTIKHPCVALFYAIALRGGVLVLVDYILGFYRSVD